MTPYYSDDLVTLYHGKNEDVLPHLAGGFDLVFTSPPYNLGTTTGGGFGHWKDGDKRGGNGKWGGSTDGGIIYGEHDDAMPMDEYEAWQQSVLMACWAHLSDNGAIFYNHKPRPQRTLWHPRRCVPDCLPIRQEIIWKRSGGVNFAPTHFLPTYEVIIVIAKDEWRLKSKAASGIGDVWEIHQEQNNPHPAPFPIGLPNRAIEGAAPTLILDPFAGSGTTLRAAKNAGIPSVGIEISERFCEMTATRLAQGALEFGGAA